MSLSISGPCLPPSSSLPPIRSLLTATEEQITLSLRNLQTLYCPLRLPASLPKKVRRKGIDIPAASTPIPVDSGYASQDEDEDDGAVEEAIAGIRADPFERNLTTRWLTSLIGRVEEMSFNDDVKAKMVDDAAFILSSFSDASTAMEEQSLTRTFAFPLSSGATIQVTLNDAPLSTTDHTDVGLQSWGASIVLSSMICADPAAFDLSLSPPSTQPKSIMELGAGTGLVSLTIAKLLLATTTTPAHITATDYHPAVLENCRKNITTNFATQPCSSPPLLSAALLDWSRPPPHLHASTSLLIASDVVYAPEHAAWLRDCAAHLLTPDGVFWLMLTVRENGKFDGIPATLDLAFAPEKCPVDREGRRFAVLSRRAVEKRSGIGRGDERGYVLYRIGWREV